MVSTITTATASPTGIASPLALISILVLIALLVQKVLFLPDSNERFRDLSSVLNVAIAPLLVAFFLIVLVRMAEILK